MRTAFLPISCFSFPSRRRKWYHNCHTLGTGTSVPNSSQIVISSRKHRGKRYRPYAFTEQGVAMLSSVLNSERAVKVNIAIMRAFVKLRETLETNRELARKFAELEQRVGKHDEEIAAIIEPFGS